MACIYSIQQFVIGVLIEKDSVNLPIVFAVYLKFMAVARGEIIYPWHQQSYADSYTAVESLNEVN